MCNNREKLKIRPECHNCKFLIGDIPETATCKKNNTPTCFRKKKTCIDKMFLNKKGIAYTDGSYNPATRKYGTGVCLYIDGNKEIYTDSHYDANGGRQIQGEINGALKACEMALEAGCDELEIRYDYNGVEAWALGYWKTNKEYTIQYASDMQAFMKKIKISFKHVKAHKGNQGNEYADELAKKACGIYTKNENEKNYVPDIPKDVNEECKRTIESFYQKSNPSFRDFVDLKTYGIDPYSRKGFQELEKYAKKHSADNVLEELGKGATGKDFCACIRWMMRGLSKNDAVRKVQVDIEIRENCQK